MENLTLTTKRDRDAHAEAAFQRSSVYELLSHVFGEPSAGFVDFITGGEFLEHIDKSLSCYPGKNDIDTRLLAAAAEEVKPLGLDGLILEYEERITSRRMNFLYECNYHPPLTSAVEMADIAGFYRAFNLGFSGDRPDHISMELEFMRLLTMKEAKSIMADDGEHAEICTAAQIKFLAAHTGRWVAAMSGMMEGTRFYGQMSRFLDAWIAAECRRLSIDVDAVFYTHLKGADEEDAAFCIKEATHERV
jgi:hypothetical protein